MKGNITVMGHQVSLPSIKNLPLKGLAYQLTGVQPMSNVAGKIFTIKQNYEHKYKFSRAKWHVADFNTDYYFEVEEWCKDHFGPHPRFPDAWSRWVHTYEDQIHFRDEVDYILFSLRWGGQ